MPKWLPIDESYGGFHLDRHSNSTCRCTYSKYSRGRENSGYADSTVSDMEAAARKYMPWVVRLIVVKGGHHIGNAVDVLFDGENFYHFETSRIDTKNTHGTGCTFSSAIASQLAKGKSVPLAVESAKAYVTMAIEHSLAIGKGCGPTHHLRMYQHGLS